MKHSGIPKHAAKNLRGENDETMIVRNDPGDSITELFSCEQLISESGESQNTQTAWVYLQRVALAFIFLQQLFQLWLSNDEKAQFEM